MTDRAITEVSPNVLRRTSAGVQGHGSDKEHQNKQAERDGTAAHEVLRTPEMAEAIMLQLTPVELFSARNTSALFREVSLISPELGARLGYRARSPRRGQPTIRPAINTIIPFEFGVGHWTLRFWVNRQQQGQTEYTWTLQAARPNYALVHHAARPRPVALPPVVMNMLIVNPPARSQVRLAMEHVPDSAITHGPQASTIRVIRDVVDYLPFLDQQVNSPLVTAWLQYWPTQMTQVQSRHGVRAWLDLAINNALAHGDQASADRDTQRRDALIDTIDRCFTHFARAWTLRHQRTTASRGRGYGRGQRARGRG